MPILPGVWMLVGMMPNLVFVAGWMMPGQLGPMSWMPVFFRTSLTLIMLCCGMCSVMQTIRPTPAFAASIIAAAAAATGAGTKMSDAFAPVLAMQSATVP
jgi:hypothetical protein